MTCPCDVRSWPPALSIVPGLDDLPRQLVTFADLRAEMLARASLQPALGAWSGRSRDDYGVMFLELWAYVGELLSIYDKAIADESYMRTAKLRPSLRRIVASLGYVPRPAVAASAEIALLAEGSRPVVVPATTGFRSGSFGSEKPQVFELMAPATIHPALNQWALATPPSTTLSGSVDQLLLDPATARVAIGDVVLVELTGGAGDAHVRKVKAMERIVDESGRRVARMTLDQALDAGAGVPVSGVRIRRATRKAALKSPTVADDMPAFFPTVFGIYFVLDGVYRDLHQSERFLLEQGGEQRWATVDLRQEIDFTLVASSTTAPMTITLKDGSGANTGTVDVPSRAVAAVKGVHTLLGTADLIDDPSRKATPASPDWAAVKDVTAFTIHFALIDAGRVLGAASRTLVVTDPLRALGTRLPVNSSPATDRILLRDREGNAAEISVGIALDTGVITPGGGTSWSPPLATPVTGFGNVVTVGRGETVPLDILGDGDASQSHQAFALKHKPLTYVTAPGTDSGVASTLQLWVDGLLWSEVPTLFGHDGKAQVYVVRQDDDAVSTVTFGDGIRGARLTSGVGNVVASYRYGAGAAAPPAGSISQLAKPVPGLKSAVAPLAATGGADPEPASSLAMLAPRSALLLGRAISIDDMEVAALVAPGVVTARADWTWDGTRQRPVVKVWVVGDGVDEAVAARLLALTEPNTPITVLVATAISASLTVDLELDPRRVAATVLASVTSALIGPGGWLLPARQGIDRPLFRSELVAFLLGITGVTGVRGLTWNKDPFLAYARTPGVGGYFELASGLTVTGSAS